MRSLRSLCHITTMLVLLTGCVHQQPDAGEPEVPSVDRFAGSSWQLVEILSMDDSRFVPAPDRVYSLTFNADSSLLIVADCNRGRGTWRSDGPGQLNIQPLAMTRAYCQDAALFNRFISDLGYIRSFLFQNNRLYLATMADGSILVFRRIALANRTKD